MAVDKCSDKKWQHAALSDNDKVIKNPMSVILGEIKIKSKHFTLTVRLREKMPYKTQDQICILIVAVFQVTTCCLPRIIQLKFC